MSDPAWFWWERQACANDPPDDWNTNPVHLKAETLRRIAETCGGCPVLERCFQETDRLFPVRTGHGRKATQHNELTFRAGLWWGENRHPKEQPLTQYPASKTAVERLRKAGLIQ